MIRTCTVEVMFSHTRGGANMMCGPISRMSSITVDGSSGKLMVKPMVSPLDMHIICSPIHASGRKETNSSPGSLASTWLRLPAMVSRLRKLSIAPLGKPVVPEV